VARVGEAPALNAAPPRLSVDSVRLIEDPAEGLIATGVVSNRSKIAQRGVAAAARSSRPGAR
jgi:hypothetical protein